MLYSDQRYVEPTGALPGRCSAGGGDIPLSSRLSSRPPIVVIQPITDIDQSVLQRLIFGYETDEIYRVTRSDADAVTTFELSLTSLPQRL